MSRYDNLGSPEHSGFPIGGVAWMRHTDVPTFLSKNPNWVEMKGQLINEPRSPFNDKTLPPMNGVFLSIQSSYQSVSSTSITEIGSATKKVKLTESYLPPMSVSFAPKYTATVESASITDGFTADVNISSEDLLDVNTISTKTSGGISYDTTGNVTNATYRYLAASTTEWDGMNIWKSSHTHAVSVSHGSSEHSSWEKNDLGIKWPSTKLKVKVDSALPTSSSAQTSASFNQKIQCLSRILVMRIY